MGGQIEEYIGRQKAEELIRYADSIYLENGAPTLVHGENDREVERIAYECNRWGIRLISCPVRRLGTDNAFYGAVQHVRSSGGPRENFTFLPRTTAVTVLAR